jgi:leucyl aminopeptidase
MKFSHKITLGLLSAISFAVQAAPAQQQNIIVAPTCLLKNVSNMEYKTLAKTQSLVLIETNQAGIHQLADAKHLKTTIPCGGFMDVTSEWQQHLNKRAMTTHHATTFLKQYDDHNTQNQNNNNQPKYSIQYTKQVEQLLTLIDPQAIWNDLTAFSNTNADQFPDRYADSDTGVKAAMWLKEKIETLAKENNRTDISVRTVATGTRYKQPSVVVKIGDSEEPGIVIGGHMDTLSSTGWPPLQNQTAFSPKPGADDDGSGSMTVMAVAKALISSGMHFKKPIYIIWYSAEEMGLVGSKYVVQDFVSKKIPVDAVMQLDMTGYRYKNDPTMWIITDHVNSTLTTYLEKLIQTYVKQPISRTRCGYSCSDHASWDKAGFTAAFPVEASLQTDNPNIHTSNDKIEFLSAEHMANFAKLGTAFAVELAEPVA